MPVCKYCGKRFNLGEARKKVGRKFGAGTYDEIYDEDMCAECAIDELNAAEGANDWMDED